MQLTENTVHERRITVVFTEAEIIDILYAHVEKAVGLWDGDFLKREATTTAPISRGEDQIIEFKIELTVDLDKLTKASPEVVYGLLEEIYTFDKFVRHGVDSGATLCGDSRMPWSFNFKGCPVTHENDDRYKILVPPRADGTPGKDIALNRGEELVVNLRDQTIMVRRETKLTPLVAKDQSDPVKGEIFTFEEFVAYGKEYSRVSDAAVWSFDFKGGQATYESADCYLIAVPGYITPVKFNRGEELLVSPTGKMFTRRPGAGWPL